LDKTWKDCLQPFDGINDIPSAIEVLDARCNHAATKFRDTNKIRNALFIESIDFLRFYFHIRYRIFSQNPNQEAEAKALIITRFANHLFSGNRLNEEGFPIEALIISRSAVEALAYFWLICLDPSEATNFFRSPQQKSN
jgi:hypothetical protein